MLVYFNSGLARWAEPYMLVDVDQVAAFNLAIRATYEKGNLTNGHCRVWRWAVGGWTGCP
jgi:hypothetical protein